MIWKPFKCGDDEFDLGHLDPFTITVSSNAPGPAWVDRKVRVVFGCHTFTKEWEEGDDPSLRFEDEGHLRCFCPSRYALSVSLPDLIRQAATRQVHYNDKGSPFLTVHNIPGANGPYVIYFNAIKATKGGGLNVVVEVRSAHCKPGFVPTSPKILFATIVGLKAAGRPVNRPKK